MSDLGKSPTYEDAAGTIRSADGVFGSFVVESGGNVETGRVNVTTSPVMIVDARPGRRLLVISSASPVPFYVGSDDVTASTGLYVAGVSGASVAIETSAAVYAVGSSALVLTYMEVF